MSWAALRKSSVLTRPSKSTTACLVGASTVGDTKCKGSAYSVVLSASRENTFLVPVPKRTADTLMAVLRDRIELGTTLISDCWSAYHDIETHCYTHGAVNHIIGFVDVRLALMNTIAST
jgi:hypothetical protein